MTLWPIDFDLEAKNSFLNFVAARAIRVSQTHLDFLFYECYVFFFASWTGWD